MIEEPYRWIEAISNRREYIHDQLKSGRPLVLLAYKDGLLLFDIGREHQKIFEIYDSIAFAAMGHPADIEKLRMLAIDMAHMEGFNRSTTDVSLRRLVNYGIAPTMKNAFEQVFSSPIIARLIIAELGNSPDDDVYFKLEYDGSFASHGSGNSTRLYEVIGAHAASERVMSDYLDRANVDGKMALDEALVLALETWVSGYRATETSEDEPALPPDFDLKKAIREELKSGTIEAAILDRHRPGDCKYHRLEQKFLRNLLKEI